MVAGRICGKVLQIVPAGLVVESGYTNLLNPEFSHSWLVPGDITASLSAKSCRRKFARCRVCGIGARDRHSERPAVKAYDYVIFRFIPAGQYNYAPVPGVKKTIRRFSVGLPTAVQLNHAAGENNLSVPVSHSCRCFRFSLCAVVGAIFCANFFTTTHSASPKTSSRHMDWLRVHRPRLGCKCRSVRAANFHDCSPRPAHSKTRLISCRMKR